MTKTCIYNLRKAPKTTQDLIEVLNHEKRDQNLHLQYKKYTKNRTRPDAGRKLQILDPNLHLQSQK